MTFQSTLPLRGTTYSYWISPSVQIFQSTLPLRGATIGGFQHFVPAEISIHTPLAGSDLLHAPCPAHRKYFNPHSPCGERRYGKAVEQTVWEFQSTLPLRGATSRPPSSSSPCRYFNPHSPCGERLKSADKNDVLDIFQSTLPLRGATTSSTNTRAMTDYFNPHSPCGERHSIRANAPCSRIFQSTLPLRGATDPPTLDIKPYRFQSTLPLRGATGTCCPPIRIRFISIHTPLAGSDFHVRWLYPFAHQFQSTLPLRGATRNPSTRPRNQQYFNPHSPCGERLCNAFDVASPQSFQSTLPLRGATEKQICGTSTK